MVICQITIPTLSHPSDLRQHSPQAEAQQSARAEATLHPNPEEELNLDTCLEEDLGFNVIGNGNNPWKEKATERELPRHRMHAAEQNARSGADRYRAT